MPLGKGSFLHWYQKQPITIIADISAGSECYCLWIINPSFLTVQNDSETWCCLCQKSSFRGEMQWETTWSAAYMCKTAFQKDWNAVGCVSLFPQTAWSEASCGLPLCLETQRQPLCENAKLRLALAGRLTRQCPRGARGNHTVLSLKHLKQNTSGYTQRKTTKMVHKQQVRNNSRMV